jgi:C-terminal processing protease CtpA/Prc
MRKWVILVLFSVILIAVSCHYPSDGTPPTENRIGQKGAREDLEAYVRILKNAHPALYAFSSESRFTRLYDSLHRNMNSTLSVREFYQALNVLNNEVACVHTNIYLPEANRSALDSFAAFFPYPVSLVENKLLVNIAGKAIPEGSEIISINNEPVQYVLDQLEPLQTADGNANTARRWLAAEDFSYSFFMVYGPGTTFTVEYRDANDSSLRFKNLKAVNFSTVTSNNSDRFYYDPTDIDYDFYTNDSVGYAVMTVRTFDYSTYSRDRAFEHFCQNSFEVLQHKPGIRRLIIDIRQNDGGNYSNCHLLYSWLSPQRFRSYENVYTRVRRLPQPDMLSVDYNADIDERVEDLVGDEFSKITTGRYEIKDSANEWITPMAKRFKGDVVVITNSEVSSAAAYFASMVKNSGRGIVIGEESRGGGFVHNGFINVVYQLPNSGISFAFSIANVRHSFGKVEDFGHGVIPNTFVPTLRKDFINSRDTQLSYVIDSLFN